MSKPRRELNPPLESGDRIMCLHMDGETEVPPGTFGTVKSVTRDPFDDDGQIINMRWDNGSGLGLLSITDSWVKEDKEPIEEQTGVKEFDFFEKNPEIFENFDYRFLRDYLLKVRDSGVINMYQAAAFLYSGREWIDRYYGEHEEDNEAFQEVLDMSEEAKNKIIQGTLKYMESTGKSLDDMGRFNSYAQRFSQKLVQLYMTFF